MNRQRKQSCKKNVQPDIQFYPALTENIHYSKELEKVVLGACLLERHTFSRTYKLVEPEHFYNPYHIELYRYLLEMFEQS
ncbi:MAG TPA: DnaB-like helicase N-terminal domain-containing protein, partial [Chitinophagaceae bacterium]|nr:DnaB-like helicase N-terminal domain-containing protein [Chitinophagaceae bacterium]